IDLQLRQVFFAIGRLPADFVEQGVVDVETGKNRTFARCDEIDVGGLVPDDVVTPQVLHQHQHEERVDHRIQATAKLGADIVAVVPAKAHGHLNVPEIVTDVPHPNPGAEVRRVEAHEHAHQPRFTEFANQPLKHPGEYPDPWPAGRTSVWPVATDQ